MRRRVRLLVLAAAAAGALAPAPQPADPAAARSVPDPAQVCPVFPRDNWWNADVRALAVHARSSQWLSHMQATTRTLHPDFGDSGGQMPYGIPITYVRGAHARVPVTFTYDDESDHVAYPLGSRTAIEGGWSADGDRHAIVVRTDTCTLYETWDTRLTASGWTAGSGAVWSLRSNALRPAGWTSADAAGLPVLPGLLRYDEVRRGRVTHAIRFTTNVTDRRYLWPARHHAGSVTDPAYPPMGARFRLKASYPLTGLRADTRAVLTAMKTYGLVLADNGSPWFFQGEAVTGWPDGLIAQLKQVPATAFEAVDTAPMMISPDSAAVRP
jgi:hypothetical protein